MKTQERASGAEPLTAEVWKEKDDTEVRWLGGAELARHLSRAKLLPCPFGTYDAPEAVPHNGSLILARKALGDAAARLASDAIGAPVIFGAE